MSKAPEHLSQQELESYLWGAATLLRGLIDAGDYKQFIFPLLFFKRLSDVWDEEYQTALDETERRDLRARHRRRPLRDPRRCALVRRPRRLARRRPGAPERVPRDRGGQPRTARPASSATRHGPTRSSCPTRR